MWKNLKNIWQYGTILKKNIKIVQKNPNSFQYSEIEVKHGEKVKRLNEKNLH